MGGQKNGGRNWGAETVCPDGGSWILCSDLRAIPIAKFGASRASSQFQQHSCVRSRPEISFAVVDSGSFVSKNPSNPSFLRIYCMPRLIQLFALATALGSLLITDCPRGRAQDRAVIQTGKASVALVEVGKDKVASAFCIDPLGVFVTNHHVVEDLGLRGSVKLVMQSSEADEWSLSAEVVLMNKADDLAVLKAYSVPRDKKLTAV